MSFKKVVPKKLHFALSRVFERRNLFNIVHEILPFFNSIPRETNSITLRLALWIIEEIFVEEHHKRVVHAYVKWILVSSLSPATLDLEGMTKEAFTSIKTAWMSAIEGLLQTHESNLEITTDFRNDIRIMIQREDREAFTTMPLKQIVNTMINMLLVRNNLH